MPFKAIKIGRVEQYIHDKIEKGPIHMVLLDPDTMPKDLAANVARAAEEAGSAAIMVGGSTVCSQIEMDEFVKILKEVVSIPIIIFPNNIQAITKRADAIWYMTLLNSVEWYYVIGAQTQAALLIKQYGIEPIPMAYLIFNANTAVASMGRALPLPDNQPEVVVAYALAAQYLGLRFVYLEAGSGARKPISPNVVKAVRSNVDIPIVVGGGIRGIYQADELIRSGADIIVTGTIAEKDCSKLKQIVKAINSSRKS